MEGMETDREDNVNHILPEPDHTPRVPRVAAVLIVELNLPAAELLVQPPPVVTIAHLEI